MRANPPPIATVFRALSDPTRLRILNLLREGEVCVCYLVAVLGVPQPTASRHLAYLRRAGLVEVRKEGLWCYYRLTPARCKSRELLAACLTQCFVDDSVFVHDTEQLRLRLRTCCLD